VRQLCGVCVGAVYLLSNNHINGLIATPFDSDEEELLAYYISFMKTLSLNLNEMTIQFFFNQVRCRLVLPLSLSLSLSLSTGILGPPVTEMRRRRIRLQGLKSNQFPLYSEAIKFFQHSESMVRIAVRTITLNVYRGARR
jgi:protein CLEC16A